MDHAAALCQRFSATRVRTFALIPRRLGPKVPWRGVFCSAASPLLVGGLAPTTVYAMLVAVLAVFGHGGRVQRARTHGDHGHPCPWSAANASRTSAASSSSATAYSDREGEIVIMFT